MKNPPKNLDAHPLTIKGTTHSFSLKYCLPRDIVLFTCLENRLALLSRSVLYSDLGRETWRGLGGEGRGDA